MPELHTMNISPATRDAGPRSYQKPRRRQPPPQRSIGAHQGGRSVRPVNSRWFTQAARVQIDPVEFTAINQMIKLGSKSRIDA